MASFSLQKWHSNNDTWGPTEDAFESAYFSQHPQISNLYMDFRKSERVGRIVDWTTLTAGTDSRFKNYSMNSKRDTSGISFFVVEDETLGYEKVEKKIKTQQKKPNQRYVLQKGSARTRRVPYRAPTRSYGAYRQQDNERMSAAITIKEDWELRQSVEFSELKKATLEAPEFEVIAQCGKLDYYNRKVFSLVSTKAPKNLNASNVEMGSFTTPTTSSDPVIQQYIKDKSPKKTAFGVDYVFSQIMAATKSVFSWEVQVTKKDGNLFFDKVGDSLEQHSVNETSVDYKPQSLEDLAAISMQHTKVNNAFSQLILNKSQGSVSLGAANPIDKKEQPSRAFVYHKFSLTDEDVEIDVVCRSQVDAAWPSSSADSSKPAFITTRAVTELHYDLKVPLWKVKIDTMKGDILTYENRNNALKLSKWACEAALSQSEKIVLGFATPNNNSQFSHIVQGIQEFSLVEFERTLSLNLEHFWGALHVVIKFCMDQPDGVYKLIKENYETPVLKLFAINNTNNNNNN